MFPLESWKVEPLFCFVVSNRLTERRKHQVGMIVDDFLAAVHASVAH